jgi:hypothetical protein
VLGLRDVGWAVALGALLVALVHYRGSASAMRAVARDAEQGLRIAYEDAPTFAVQRLQIVGTRQSLTGRSVEIVARQFITLDRGVTDSEQASLEVHAKLERSAAGWKYTLFETRDGQLIEPPGDGNPWARSLRARRGAPGAEPSAPPVAPPAPTSGD